MGSDATDAQQSRDVHRTPWVAGAGCGWGWLRLGGWMGSDATDAQQSSDVHRTHGWLMWLGGLGGWMGSDATDAQQSSDVHRTPSTPSSSH